MDVDFSKEGVANERCKRMISIADTICVLSVENAIKEVKEKYWHWGSPIVWYPR